MKRKTYNNVLKATKMLQNKGYDFAEAGQLALNVFEQHENEERTIEFYIGLILPKQEFEAQYSLRGGNGMQIVKCVSERVTMPGQLEIGGYYWMDETTRQKDCDGDEYAQIYYDELKQHNVGNMLTSHFVRYMK